MSILYPLGLIALASIIILIIIYLIKPNYQNKFISSTFIWKLSLKYKRKKLPTSKLRNILLILCQVLILALASLIITYPIIKYQTVEEQNETIIILDSSASMRTVDSDEYTRYERAVEKIRQLTTSQINDGGNVSLILATNTTSTLFEKYDLTRKDEIEELLDGLLEGETSCSYGKSDIDSAFSVCDSMLTESPNAKVYLFTDKKYEYVPKNVTLERVYDEAEKNYAILDAYTVYYDNYYDVVVELESYGFDANNSVDKSVEVSVEVQGANSYDKNDSGNVVKFNDTIDLVSGVPMKLIFKGTDSADESSNTVQLSQLPDNSKFTSYNSILVSIDEDDSYSADDSFWIYGGQKEVIKIEYSSNNSNTFVSGVLYTLQNYYSSSLDIKITEERKGKPEVKGFDYYIFEHSLPTTLPTDGVCIIIDPLSSPSNGGFAAVALGGNSVDTVALTPDLDVEDNPFLEDIDVSRIEVSRYVKFSYYDSEYTSLATIDGDPVLMYKDNGNSKIFMINFSLHYSNLPIIKEFPFLMNNIIKNFTPSIVEKNAYEVGDTINFKSRGATLEVKTADNSLNKEYDIFPASMVVNTPGTYSVSQGTYFNKNIYEDVYVRIPKEESDIFAIEDSLKDLYYEDNTIDLYNDLVLYFAIALVTVLFLEWWLKNRDNA